MKQVATEENVKLDGTDRAHFTKQGGAQIARLVAQGVKENNLWDSR